MRIVVICSEMKWTYDEYLNQPIWFLELLNLRMNLEGEHEKDLSKNVKS
jgi:hypothetical protein